MENVGIYLARHGKLCDFTSKAMKKYEKARFGHEQIGISDDLAVKKYKNSGFSMI